MKLTTLIDLMRSGQLTLMLGLKRSFREFYRTAFIATALKEGLYTRLRSGPASLQDLHACLGAAVTPLSLMQLEAWLDMGASLGELRRGRDGRYTLHSRLSKQLADPATDPQQAILQEVASLHYDLLTQAPDRLRRARPFTLADSDGELIARSSRILEAFVFEAVDAVVDALPEGERLLLEVGCGSGVYIRRALQRRPALAAVGLELQPEVAEFARRNLAQWGLAERVVVEAGDVREYTPTRPFDLVTLHNNIYYFPEAARDDLLKRLHGFLKPGGLLLLTTECQGSGFAGQALNLWAAMTEGAGPLPHPQRFCDQLRHGGFKDVRARSLMPGDSFYMFVGRKD